jgi:hypothetical protein
MHATYFDRKVVDSAASHFGSMSDGRWFIRALETGYSFTQESDLSLLLLHLLSLRLYGIMGQFLHHKTSSERPLTCWQEGFTKFFSA